MESRCVLREVRSAYLCFKQTTFSFQGQLVACFLRRSVVFDPRPVHVGHSVDEVALGLCVTVGVQAVS